MSNTERTTSEIERDIERDRGELNSTLHELRDQFSIDALIRSSGGPLKEYGEDMGRSVARAARQNPMALMLTGVGIAWMMMDKGERDDGRRLAYSSHDAPDRGESSTYGRDYADRNDKHMSPTSYPLNGQAASRYRRQTHTVPDHWLAGDEHRVGSGAEANDTSVQSDSAGFMDKAKDKGRAAAQSVKDGIAGARETAGSTADSARMRAESAYARISRGTEELSEEGRRRVLAARQRALETRESLRRRSERGAETLGDMYSDQPLIMGALALAVGAAVGGALPRTRTENEAFGEQSDELFHTAERVLDEEMQKAKVVAKAARDEAQQAGQELRDNLDNDAPQGKNAIDAVVDTAKATADRVIEAGKTEAKNQNLGSSAQAGKASK